MGDIGMLELGVTYESFAEESEMEGNRYTAYGIAVCTRATREQILAVHDVSTDGEAVADLAALCNRLGLLPSHLGDVVDDFLTRRYSLDG